MRRIRLLYEERGIVLVWVAILLVVLLGMAALAIDIGQMYIARGRAQNVCDAAALAGIRVLAQHYGHTITGIPAADTAAGDCTTGNNQSVAAWQVLVPGTDDAGVQIEFEFPEGRVQDDAGRSISVALGDAVRATGQVNVTFGFARILGFTSKKVSASATAVIIPAADICSPLLVPLLVSADTITGIEGSLDPIEFGERQVLHLGDLDRDNNFLGPGNFYSAAFEDDRGGDDYRERLAGVAGDT